MNQSFTIKRKCVIFDVDGTIADNSHRQHWVRSKPRNWKAFNATMHEDKPIHNVIQILKLFFQNSDAKVIIVTARSKDEELVTRAWLKHHNIPYDHIYFRAAKDYRDDAIIKSEILDKVLEEFEPLMVFDDRNRVVDMWRQRGIQCLQVAPGDF